jgi:hypothetical protein
MLETLAAPSVLPVSLAAAKAWLRETSTDWDAEITDRVWAAVGHAETITHRATVYRQMREQFDYFLPYMELSGVPARGISLITYLDTSGVLQTLDPTRYLFDRTRGQPRLIPAYMTFFPPVRQILNSVQIYYDLGAFVPVTGMDGATNIITAPGHNKAAGDTVQFATDGDAASVLPANVKAAATYYAINPTATTYQISATSGGGVFALGAGFAGSIFIVDDYDYWRAIKQALSLILNAWATFPSDLTAAHVETLPIRGVESLLSPFMPRGF